MPTTEAGTTRIQLCGRLKVDYDGRHVTPALRGRQGRVLLAYLVLNRGRSVSRDELLEAIWPESSPADPPAALRTQLSRLRSALGSDAVAGRDTIELRLPENTWVDMEAAERAIRVADSALREGDWKDAWTHAHVALNIAGRPFLAGFEAPWVEEVRRELVELELRAREVIAQAGIGLGGSELAGAERSARSLIRAAPFRESGYLHLMRTLIASGNTAEALRTYDDLRKLLARELGSAPGPEIQALHRKLLGGAELDLGAPASRRDLGHPLAPAEATGPPLPTWLRAGRGGPFVGRAPELGRLLQLWEEARRGSPQFALIGGEPGIGKTRVVAELGQRAHGGGAVVLYGRADEEATLAYQPFVEALRHWSANVSVTQIEHDLGSHAQAIASLVPEVSAKLPPLPPSNTADLTRDRLFDAIASTLSAIAADRPLLLILDDLHWADQGSLLMLRHIARSLGDSAVMVAVTYRPTEPSPALTETLADLGRERLFERIRLVGLDRAEVSEIVSALHAGGEPVIGLAEVLHEDTGGNPFLIEALVNNIGAGELDAAAGIGARERLYEHGIPDLISESIADRIADLGPVTAKVLEVAATIGSEFESELLVEVADPPAEESLASLEAAATAGLLADAPGTLERYSFSHDLFRQAIYTAIPKRRRAELHRRVAEVLGRLHGSDPRHLAELARHYADAGVTSAPKALEYSVRAGAGALGALSFEQAVGHYRQALAALDASGSGDDSVRGEILIALGEAQWRLGELAASRESLRRAFSLAERSGDPETLGRAALGFCGFGWEMHAGGDPSAINLLRSALAREGLPGALRARLLARLATSLQSVDRSEEMDRLSQEALEAAETSGDQEAMAAALIGRWHSVAGPGGAEIRSQLTGQLRTIAAALKNRDLELQALRLQVVVLLELGHFADLDVAIAEHARLADRMKQPIAKIRSKTFQAMRALLDGRFKAAEETIEELVELGAPAGSSTAFELSVIEMFALHMEQGRLGELEGPVRRLAESAIAAPAWRVALTYLLTETGEGQAARGLLEEIAAEDFAAVPKDSTELAAFAFLAASAARIGDATRMEQLADRIAPYQGLPVVIGAGAAYAGTASDYLGLLSIELGRRDAAVNYLEEAVKINQRAGALPWLARSRFELSRALAGRGAGEDAERAGEQLAQASLIAERLGMAPLLEHLGASGSDRDAGVG